MSRNRVVSYNPVMKSKTIITRESADQIRIETQTDATDIFEQNKAEYNASEKHDRWGDGQVVARIPLELYFKMLKSGELDPDGYPTDDSEKALLKLLDDPSYQKLRTRRGLLSR